VAMAAGDADKFQKALQHGFLPGDEAGLGHTENLWRPVRRLTNCVTWCEPRLRRTASRSNEPSKPDPQRAHRRNDINGGRRACSGAAGVRPEKQAVWLPSFVAGWPDQSARKPGS
jgi:hypothetical protein